MRYAIFSDVHANLEALETVCRYYRGQHIDSFIFIGDIIGYGANPQQCLHLLKSLSPFCLAGNHEWGLLNKLALSWFNSYARDALLWTRQHLDASDCVYLEGFSLIYQQEDFVCVHGSLEEPENFNYILSCNEAARCFSFLKKRLCFIGHSHRPGIFYENKSRIMSEQKDELRLEVGTRYIINVGSVGQPRDRDPRASCCIYDSDKGIVKFKRLEYNISNAAEKIQAAGLPSVLAWRLFEGW